MAQPSAASAAATAADEKSSPSSPTDTLESRHHQLSPAQYKVLTKAIANNAFLKMFDKVEDAHRRALLDGFRLQRFRQGQYVFLQGDEGVSFYVIVEGKFEVYQVCYNSVNNNTTNSPSQAKLYLRDSLQFLSVTLSGSTEGAHNAQSRQFWRSCLDE